MYNLHFVSKGFSWLMTLVLVVFFSGFVQAQTVIYVDQTSTGNGDGSTWVDAYNQLEDALTAASSGDEIWMAQGIYLPGDTIHSRFVITKDIRIYGGFSGAETQLSERNPVLYPTILSGDVLGDDFPSNTQDNRWDNLYTILEIQASVTSATIIDGLIFRGGHAVGDNFFLTNAWGGAIFCEGAPQIRGCIFEDNYADKRGGAIYIQSDHANGMLIKDCYFKGNKSNEDGGAVFVNQTDESGVFLDDNTFELNKSDRRGGAICVNNANSHLKGNTFSNNQSRRTGGAMHVQASYNFLNNTIDSCFFKSNVSTRGGALYLTSSSVFGAVNNQFQVTRTDFLGNHAEDLTNNPDDAVHSGAISVDVNVNASETKIVFEGCNWDSNKSDGAAGMGLFKIDGQETSLTVINSQIGYNFSDDGDGPTVIEADLLGEANVLIDSCDFINNHSQKGAGGIVVKCSGNSIVDLDLNDVYIFGQSGLFGAGVVLTTVGLSKLDCRMKECDFLLNSSQTGHLVLNDMNQNMFVHYQNGYWSENFIDHGNGILITSAGEKTQEINPRFIFENILFDWLEGTGSCIRLSNVDARFQNCTIARNDVPTLALEEGARVMLQNNIFASIGQDELSEIGPNEQIISLGGNVIDDNSLEPYLGVTDLSGTDPEFTSVGDNYTLSVVSPGIDFGTLPDSIYPFDLAGNARIQGNGIDAGAYESPFTSSIVAERAPSVSMEIWPNPASEFVSIAWHEGFTSAADIRILDASGRIVLEMPEGIKAGQTKAIVSLSGLSSGTYSAGVYTADKLLAVGAFVIISSN